MAYTLASSHLHGCQRQEISYLSRTPYFLPTEGLNQALQIAALGGVDVRLMLPKRSDTRTANMATHSFIDEMVKAGVKVYSINRDPSSRN